MQTLSSVILFSFYPVFSSFLFVFCSAYLDCEVQMHTTVVSSFGKRLKYRQIYTIPTHKP